MGTKPSVDRDEPLRLLREDEEFRYAVMGLLGIADLRSDLKRLADALDNALEAVKGLTNDSSVANKSLFMNTTCLPFRSLVIS